MSFLYHLGKVNVIVDTLSRLSMNSLVYVENDKKESVKDVYRLVYLGVRLVDSDEGRVLIHNDSKSSLVANVKEKLEKNLS